ncbi:site-specific DNA-methyltransferase [Leuconostoc citreum]|uniref:site-specific DNA-methyltransferase n=2 Tax=Lactobacillaceae TaxID=33958 RepID=UPI0021822058|nr:site-specific DNA-methyltransferase [Leuconostoc citreum]MCS8587555.1 site-specific DNA-methyltransferase [Leuconostoc citreum]MCS8599847.1 site-specific DNA-methyltransferase [Leuconostoc citreum]
MIDSKIMETTKSILKDFGNTYFSDKGTLKRNKVIEDLDAYTPMLMKALLANQLIHDTYTESIVIEDKSVELFKLNQFIEMFTYKEYWQDSYTKFENKIGLTAGGKFIDETADVVLDFPFKDTVLKAGMTKEDQKDADEPFLHETIAKAEIDQLLEPKILVNATKYDQENLDGAPVDTFEDNNLIIKGNNLIALNSLKKRYTGCVKLIYLDVPYFFKKTISEDAFKYNSNFHLSAWLTFLKNRLEIAKELLSEKGSIWINISEDGMHYLKVLADSVFTNDKFVGTIPRKTRNGKSDVPYNLSQDFDWILVYTAGFENDEIIGRQVKRQYLETEDFPNRPWRKADITKQTTIQQRPNSNFTMINPKTGKEYPVNPKRSWAVAKDTFQEWYENGGIGFPDDYDFMSGDRPFRRIFKDEDDDKNKSSAVYSDFLLKLYSGKTVNKLGNDQIDNLFERNDFDYAKPEELLSEIMKVTTTEHDMVLDFFMGSATTQAVAMKMKRRFIGIEQMDYIKTVSVERLKKVIAGEQGGISKDANWQGGGSFVYAELMEKNQGYLKDVQQAETTKQLENVVNRMIEGGADFDFRVDVEKVLQDPEYQAMALADKKQLIVKVIDKNQLYYAYSDMDDHNVQELMSDSDIAFNKSFYGERDL